MIKFLLIFGIVISMGLTGVYSANAERSVIDTPFKNDRLSCHGPVTVGDEKKYFCEWTGLSETVTKEAIRNAGEVPEEQLIQESKEEHEAAKQQVEKVKDTRTDVEITIDRLIEKRDKGKANPADIKLLTVLEGIQNECELGIDQGALIQKYLKLTVRL